MGKNFLILHADGDDENRLEIVEMLEKLGANVEEARTGDEALNLINSNEFDVIIVDYALPDYDGIELLPLIRDMTDAPVIVITSNGDEMLAVKAMKYGAVDYIPRRQITIEKLKIAIEAAAQDSKETAFIKNKRINAIEELRGISQRARHKINCLVA